MHTRQMLMVMVCLPISYKWGIEEDSERRNISKTDTHTHLTMRYVWMCVDRERATAKSSYRSRHKHITLAWYIVGVASPIHQATREKKTTQKRGKKICYNKYFGVKQQTKTHNELKRNKAKTENKITLNKTRHK